MTSPDEYLVARFSVRYSSTLRRRLGLMRRCVDWAFRAGRMPWPAPVEVIFVNSTYLAKDVVAPRCLRA